MASIVARVRLVEGQTGFYDELSGVTLNWNRPVANVYLGANLTHLRRALKNHKIKVIEGSLGTSKTFKQILMEGKSRRTGIDLKTLMGNTPLAKEPTDVIDSDDTIHNETPVETIDAAAPTLASTPSPKSAPAPVITGQEPETIQADEPEKTPELFEDEPEPALEMQQIELTPKSVRSFKVGSTKTISLNLMASGVTVVEGEEFVTAELAKDGMSFTILGIAPGSAVIEVQPGIKMCEGATLSLKVVEA